MPDNPWLNIRPKVSGRFLPAPRRWHNEGEQPLHLRCRCNNLHSKHLSGIHHWLGRASHQSSEACLHILIIMTSAPSQQRWLGGGGRQRHLIIASSEVLRNFITLARFIWRSPRRSQLCLLTFLLAPYSHASRRHGELCEADAWCGSVPSAKRREAQTYVIKLGF